LYNNNNNFDFSSNHSIIYFSVWNSFWTVIYHQIISMFPYSWVFYEWITCNEKPRCAPIIFPRNVLAGNINRWKNITADRLILKNGTTTIWIWKHWNNLMVNNCSKRISNWEIDDIFLKTFDMCNQLAFSRNF
jgi:hypothetical protein